jgi:tetratricopeptide (TPR) repeat protein
MLPDDKTFVASGRAYTFLSEVCYQRGDYSEGLELIKKALEDTEDYYNFWMAGRLAAGAGDVELANEFAGRIGGLFNSGDDDSTTVEAFAYRRFYYHLLGEIELHAGRFEPAADRFEQSLRFAMRVDSPFFRKYLGRACYEAGDYERAVVELNKVLEIGPYYPEALLYLGKAHMALGDDGEAGRTLDRLGEVWKDADEDYRLRVEMDELIELLKRG